MDVHTEKGNKASNSHSYEDVKEQLTGLSNHPPRCPVPGTNHTLSAHWLTSL